MPPVRQNGYGQKRRANADAHVRSRHRGNLRSACSHWLVDRAVFQYVFRPSGGIPNPYNPVGVTTRIGDAAVFGLTSVLKY
jgi:hypothetical protein